MGVFSYSSVEQIDATTITSCQEESTLRSVYNDRPSKLVKNDKKVTETYTLGKKKEKHTCYLNHFSESDYTRFSEVLTQLLKYG